MATMRSRGDHAMNDEHDTHSTGFVIGADHPSLPGHFPGNPVVPGVLVLDRVLAAAEAWTGQALGALSLPQVKFVQPLLPGQAATVRLRRAGGKLKFEVDRDGVPIARGEFGPLP